MAAAVTLLAACASIGRPQGGPRDELPPVFVRSTPMPGDTGVTRRTISLFFNENVQLEDAFNKVIVSPVQLQAPSVRANGRRVTVEMRDTLIPNTTYTIDFGDAIKDLNEGNVLDGFALDFSTGNTIDSLRISGVVLQAANLEPAQGMLVAAYDVLDDSAVRTLPPVRVARTNQYGQFTLRNLAEGQYRVYALNDVNRDWHWDRSENVAFLDTLVTPTVEDITVTDTLYRSDGTDSLVMRRGRRFMPNDVLLMWFNQEYVAQYLKNYRRDDRRRATIVLSAPPDSLPRVSIVGTALDGRPSADWAVEQYNERNDSLTLWLKSPEALADSLTLAVSYRRPDSLDVLEWVTDTLRFFYREPKRKPSPSDTLPPKYDLLKISAGSSSQDVNRPLRFAFSQPLESLDTDGVHLSMLIDTLWTPVSLPTIMPDSLDRVLGCVINMAWEPGTKYRLEVDSAAAVGIYEEHNPTFKHEFTVRKLEDYSNLTLNITGADSTAVVQLLNGSDQPVAQAPVVNGRAVLRFLNPGTYYARLFFDTDADGKWTTGLLDSIQPEEVAYYPKKIELKANWDVDQSWDIYELPIDSQKPKAILKNKPKLKRGEQLPDDEESEIDPMDEFLGGNNTVDRRRNNNTRTAQPTSRGGRNTTLAR